MWKVRNTEELFPDKVSSHSFHMALYSSWLWWKGTGTKSATQNSLFKAEWGMPNAETVPGNH